MRTRRYLLAVVCMLFMASAVFAADALVDRAAYDGNALKAPNLEVGFRFMTGANPEVVNGLGFIDLNNDTPLDGPDGDGLKSAVTVTLWQEGDTSIVAQTVVPAGEGGELYDGFRYGSVPSTTLIPNTNYVLSFNSGAILDNYLDANVAVTLNPIYVGAQPNTTWEIRWGTLGAMPTSTAAWGIGRTYGCVNMRPAPVGPKATVPSPASNQPNVPRSTNLSWTPASEPIVFAQAVYFSASPTDPNIYEDTPVLKTGDETLNGVLNAELPFALEYGAEYRWRVDTSVYENDPNTFAGAEWKFFTVPASPLIMSQPTDVVVDSGTDAMFTIEAFNPQTDDATGLTYQWYKVDAGGDIELADDADYSGVTTVTLTVSAPTYANDTGEYYCAVSNGAVTNTDNAFLTVKQQMVWLTFDGNLIDWAGSGTEYNGTYVDTTGSIPTPTVVYDTGVDEVANHALVLGSDPNIVKLANTDGAGAFDFYPRGLTVSIWAKTQQTVWGGIAAKQYRVTGEDRLGWVLDTSPAGIPTFQILQGAVYASTTTTINDGEWHLLTATYNAQEPAGRLYVDGLLVGTDTAVTTPIPTEEEPAILGAHNVQGEFRFDGSLDDLQIFNYAKTSLEVADIYFTMLPDAEDICLDGITPDGDINGDCRVDLLDWAELAGSWLECNITRSCVPLPSTIP